VVPAATVFEPEDLIKLSFADLIPIAEARQLRRTGGITASNGTSRSSQP
tara:strand:+ start:44 stop:190 length:147 start_codon:yes stop_codon:yes gene_type:complete